MASEIYPIVPTDPIILTDSQMHQQLYNQRLDIVKQVNSELQTNEQRYKKNLSWWDKLSLWADIRLNHVFTVVSTILGGVGIFQSFNLIGLAQTTQINTYNTSIPYTMSTPNNVAGDGLNKGLIWTGFVIGVLNEAFNLFHSYVTNRKLGSNAKKVEIIMRYINQLSRWFKKANTDQVITDDEYNEFKKIVENYKNDIGAVNVNETAVVKAQDDISIDEGQLKKVIDSLMKVQEKQKGQKASTSNV